MKNILFYLLARLIVLPILLLVTILICLGMLMLLPYTVTVILCGLILAGELVGWIIWVIKGLKEVEISPLDSSTKKTIIGIFASLCLVLLIGHEAYYSKCVYKETSPCGNYTLKIYDKRGLFYFSMPGGAGNYPVKGVLKNKWGWTIGKGEEVFLYDVQIDWDYERKTVCYSKGNTINF